MKEIKIIKVEVKPGATITKGMTMRGPGFAIRVNYTLDGGRVIESYAYAQRKKDVLPRVERENRSAAAGAMSASFNDKGEFWGTVQDYALESSGLLAPVAG